MDTVESLKAEIETLKSEIKSLQKLNDWYVEQLKLKAKERFGTSSEKYTDGQISLFDVFNEAETLKEPIAIEPEESVVIPEHKRKKSHRGSKLKDLPVDVIEYKLEETDAYTRLISELMIEELLHADETVLEVLHEPGKKATNKSYVWVYRTSESNTHPVIVYKYTQGRSGDYAKAFLKDWKGKYLHCDGYNGYKKLEGITRKGYYLCPESKGIFGKLLT